MKFRDMPRFVDAEIVDADEYDRLICSNLGLTSLDGCPHTILGDINCSNNRLITLEGGPEIVYGKYFAERNTLTSLKGAPSVCRVLCISENQNLTSLAHCPTNCKTLVVNRCSIFSFDHAPKNLNYFHALDNKFTSLVNIHKHFDYLGELKLDNNPIKEGWLYLLLVKGLKEVSFSAPSEVVDIFNDYLANGKGKANLVPCQLELLKYGFDEYARI